jgi:long-chain acyl-CoA synthetase
MGVRTMSARAVPEATKGAASQPDTATKAPTARTQPRTADGKKASAIELLNGMELQSLVELEQKACDVFADREMLGTKVDGGFKWITYAEFSVQVQRFRNVLSHHNIGKNDKVALIANNRVEWAVAQYASAGLGAQLVPMYEAQQEKDWRYIINDAGAKLLLVANEKIYEKTKNYVGELGNLRAIMSFDSPPDLMHSYQRWMTAVENEAAVPAIESKLDDVVVLIYTSGTTGNPKGVQLSNNNILAIARGTEVLWKEVMADHTSLSFLPWAHVFGMTVDLHGGIRTGNRVAINNVREELLENMNLVQPTMMVGVPAFFNRVYDVVNKKINEGSSIGKTLVGGAIAVARKRNHLLEYGQTVNPLLNLQYQIADKVVLSKIRGKISPSLEFFCNGGAAVSLPVVQFFEDIGLPICEGYGLTETSPIISTGVLGWKNRRLGCAGVPIPGLDVRIIDPETLEDKRPDEDGEIVCSGPSVMVGYHNNPKANEEVFFIKEGKRFFRTGDMGRLEDGKYLKITGRIKEQYKLQNGKYVVPSPLESGIERSLFILQTMLFGVGKSYNTLLVVPDFVNVREWLKKEMKGHETSIDASSDADLLQNDLVAGLIADEIVSACAGMKNYEKPHRFDFLSAPFSQDNEMLTPKMSIRRNNIIKAYNDKIEGMYQKTSGYEIRPHVKADPSSEE